MLVNEGTQVRNRTSTRSPATVLSRAMWRDEGDEPPINFTSPLSALPPQPCPLIPLVSRATFPVPFALSPGGLLSPSAPPMSCPQRPITHVIVDLLPRNPTRRHVDAPRGPLPHLPAKEIQQRDPK